MLNMSGRISWTRWNIRLQNPNEFIPAHFGGIQPRWQDCHRAQQSIRQQWIAIRTEAPFYARDCRTAVGYTTTHLAWMGLPEHTNETIQRWAWKKTRAPVCNNHTTVSVRIHQLRCHDISGEMQRKRGSSRTSNQ